ncbi:tyrosine-type recombinase/integrase [Deinococcus pimensis]|uniref:tyrosine-type recombinase/integrase n=1 Tax=Deinococcus pimensis TaxID=309888 RepID=UPI0004BB8FB4|nr:site-specific integrase [Deinococcus pimensis]
MTLDVYRADRGSRARELLALHPEERRRRAVEAAASKDAAALWALTEGYMSLYGASGILASPHTFSAYRTGVAQFAAHADRAALSLLRLTQDDAQAYVLRLLQDGRKIATVRSRVAAASALYKALRWAGATESAPFVGVRVPKDHEHPLTKNPPYSAAVIRRVVGTLEERLLGASGREREKLLRARALVLLLTHTGLRIQEALDLAWTDVHLDDDDPYLIVRSGKGRKSREVYLSDRLVAALRTTRALPLRRGADATKVLPFRTRAAASKVLAPLFVREGEYDERGRPRSDWRGCHAFRKHTGTRLYEALGDFAAVAEVLGHADINTTRAYVRVSGRRAGKVMRDW